MPVDVPWDEEGGFSRQGADRYEGLELDAFWLRFEAGGGSGKQYLVRLLDNPTKFMTHYDNQIDRNTGDRKRVPFPDSENLRKKKRNCTDQETTLQKEGGRYKRSQKCVWCRLSYQLTPRYMINVAYYGKKDDDGDPTIMMAEMPQSAYDNVRDWWTANKAVCPDGPGTLTGRAPNFLITVKLKGKKTEYSVMPTGEVGPLPTEVKNALRKFNPDAATVEEVMKLHDLKRFCGSTYMSRDVQIATFGKVVDEVPFAERKRDNDDDDDDFGSGSDASSAKQQADARSDVSSEDFGPGDDGDEGVDDGSPNLDDVFGNLGGGSAPAARESVPAESAGESSGGQSKNALDW